MKTILICDDERHMRRLIQHTLGTSGHTILTASNGIEAMAAMRNNPVDLVVLDVMLPGPDGFAVLDEMRAEFGANAPRVVMLTGRGLSTTRDQASASGVAAFLTKPFSPIELRQVVQNALV